MIDLFTLVCIGVVVYVIGVLSGKDIKNWIVNWSQKK